MRKDKIRQQHDWLEIDKIVTYNKTGFNLNETGFNKTGLNGTVLDET
jgi:hypothetical protein